MKHARTLLTVLLLAPLAALHAADAPPQSWKPANPVLMTRWGKTVTPENALPEYPRPQMVRTEWRNLNGLWQFAVGQPDEPVPVGKTLARQILVPFPMESALSGIRETAEFVWYRRTFDVPAAWRGQRLLLHFGAVDWETTVFVNGKELGKHRGGYDPFSCDITDALTPAGPQELIVSVADPMQGQAAGKQSRDIFLKPRGSIFYSCVTGIWQTVWLEPVPATHIESLKIAPDVDQGAVRVTVLATAGKDDGHLQAAVEVYDGQTKIGSARGWAGEEFVVKIPGAKLWSPDSPFLYDMKVTASGQRKNLHADEVTSYFAMRKVAIGNDARGITRILLNNQFTFMMGALDQGFWPDGIYTAPTDEALRFDIEFAKRIGLNLARKHVKVEPDRWYYWCDKLGLLVWQDMPSFSPATGYEEEMPRVIAALRNHPCLVLWVMMNEGYPSRDQQAMVTAMARQSDPSRPVTTISGWRDMGFGDVTDRHDYPGPSSPTPGPQRAVVLSEWGMTYGNVPGHDWMEVVLSKQYPAWPVSSEKLDRRHEDLLRRLWRLVHSPGLSGAAWTQLTDIEGECNGFITYDRELIKNNVTRIAAANRGYVPPIALPDVTATADIYLFTEVVSVELVAPRGDATIHYTLDGSEPNAQSPCYTAPIELTGTTTINAIAFWPNHPPSTVAAMSYKKATEFQPAVTAGKLDSGLAWEYREDEHVVQSGTMEHFTFRPTDPVVKQPKEKGQFQWTGYLQVPRDGVYTLQRPAQNMALTIGTTALFTTRGGLGDREETAQLALAAGLHRLEARWQQSRNGYYTLDCPIHIEGPGIAKQPIPAAWLKHEAP